MRRESLITFLWLGVDLDSESHVCAKHGSMVCPICGSLLIKLKFMGNDAKVLALAKRKDFLCFVGCCRVDLHNKIVDGVDYRGKVFIRTVLKGDNFNAV